MKTLDEVKKEKIDGYTKYTVGSYYSYQDAVAMKNRINAETPVSNAFIVAYRDGNRVALSSVL